MNKSAEEAPMKKGTKAPQRRTELDRITEQVRKVLRRTTRDTIELGNLLIKSRKYLEHGEWQAWLADNFDLSYQTALNYMAAAEYVEKQKSNVGDFTNVAPTVLYRLAEGHYNEQEEAEILAQAKAGKRVDQGRARDICEALAPPSSPSGPDDDVGDDSGDGGDDEAVADGDPESAAILDGPPPAVTPPEPITPPDPAVRAFDQAVAAIKQLLTKPAAQFVSTVHSARDLENVEDFIRAVADQVRAGIAGGSEAA
jgi:hypothetical protein